MAQLASFSHDSSQRLVALQAQLQTTAPAGISYFDVQHFLLRETMGGYYSPSITKERRPTRILDIGCGRGHWATDIAFIFPEAQVISFDFIGGNADAPGERAHILPTPDNYMFQAGNIFEALPFPSDCFDFTHMQRSHPFSLAPATGWASLLSELTRVTRPGGWIEIVEGARPMGGGPAFERIVSWISEACAACDLEPNAGTRLAELLGAQGLRAITGGRVLAPVGRVGGWAGHLLALHCFEFFENLAPLLFALGVTTPDVFRQAFADARLETEREEWTCELPFYYADAQRPAAH